jgi:hypothetical protein
VDKVVKRKIFLFLLIFLGEIALLVVIANVFGIETENTVFGMTATYVIFLTIMLFLIKIAKEHREELDNMEMPIFRFGGDISVLWWIYIAILVIILVLAIFVPTTLEMIRQV